MILYENIQTYSVYIVKFTINMCLELYETLAKQHSKQGQMLTQKPFLVKGFVISNNTANCISPLVTNGCLHLRLLKEKETKMSTVKTYKIDLTSLDLHKFWVPQNSKHKERRE